MQIPRQEYQQLIAKDLKRLKEAMPDPVERRYIEQTLRWSVNMLYPDSDPLPIGCPACDSSMWADQHESDCPARPDLCHNCRWREAPDRGSNDRTESWTSFQTRWLAWRLLGERDHEFAVALHKLPQKTLDRMEKHIGGGHAVDVAGYFVPCPECFKPSRHESRCCGDEKGTKE